MNKIFTCIICPNGCEISVDVNGQNITGASGNLCPRGMEYVRNEVLNPLRNLATSVLVINGDVPLCSVRLTKPIPKNAIFSAMDEIRKIKINAPVNIGDVVLKNILGYDSDVIATRKVNLK